MNNKIVALVVAVVLVIAGIYLFSSSQPTVSAQGVSSIDVTPDLVSVNVLIETKALTAQDAQDKNADIRDRVVTSLKNSGVAESKIQLGGYSVYPDYDYSNGRQIQKGYVARQDIVVKLDDFSNVAGVVDSVVGAGALVSYINFELSDEKQSEYKIQALKKAGEDARKKADATASGLGKSVGRLVSVNSEEFSYQPYPYYAKAEDSPAGTASAEVREAVASIAPQDLKVSATVNVVYKLGWF